MWMQNNCVEFAGLLLVSLGVQRKCLIINNIIKYFFLLIEWGVVVANCIYLSCGNRKCNLEVAWQMHKCTNSSRLEFAYEYYGLWNTKAI